MLQTIMLANCRLAKNHVACLVAAFRADCLVREAMQELK
jgi:hypothetical protein